MRVLLCINSQAGVELGYIAQLDPYFIRAGGLIWGLYISQKGKNLFSCNNLLHEKYQAQNPIHSDEETPSTINTHIYI
jgi:hypothetical protein